MLEQTNTKFINIFGAYYRNDFYFVDRFHGSKLRDWREHTHFVDRSSCLTADNVRNIAVTIHRSQMLNMLSLYTQTF
jgi:hypothetical protein